MTDRVHTRGERCPRCGYVQASGAPACGRCGTGPAPTGAAPTTAPSRSLSHARAWILAPEGGWIAPLVLFLTLGWLSIAIVMRSPATASQESASFLHHVIEMANLVFHEAGHWILSFLGRFVAVAGGTIFEVGIPLVCLVEFLRRRDRNGAAVGLWWSGQSLTGVAVYAADARAGRLTLLGGRTGRDAPGFHDWHNLLEWTGLLAADRWIGWALHLTGATLMGAAVAWCGWRALDAWARRHTGG